MNAAGYPEPEEAVFINCPFDPAYDQLRDAIVLAVVACNFVPLTAEDGPVAASRMDRIRDAVIRCNHSIHDLSRCTGEGESMLARFNMPLELGIAIGKRWFVELPAAHDWCVLVPEEHPYARYISDLQGYDLKMHDGTVEGVIAATMSWLARPNDFIAEPIEIARLVEPFRDEVAALQLRWRSQLPWWGRVNAAQEVLTA